MLSFLKNHPFAVEAFFTSSLVLTFAVPKDQIQKLIPDCLQLDVFQNKWAFIAIAMVETLDLRPKGFPKIFGHNFFLIGYRVFVTYTTSSGKTLRGLYILKSETNKKRMELLGNIFTHYNYSTTDINEIISENKIVITSKKSHISLVIENRDNSVLLPDESPFADWKEAQRYEDHYLLHLATSLKIIRY